MKRYSKPTDRGTLLKYQQYKDGIIPPEQFSFPQFNLRRLVINPLMHIGRYNPDFIEDIWKPEVEARHLRMSGLNLFIQQNATQLYASIDKTKEYDPLSNTPDLRKMEISQGILEGTKSFSVTYSAGTLWWTWNTEHWGNGKDTDDVYGIIIAKPLLESYGRSGNWEPALKMFGPEKIGTRITGHATWNIEPDLIADDLTAFIFFFAIVTDGKNIWSPSSSKQVT